MSGQAIPLDYAVFGLRIRSELALPELFEPAGPGEPDVQIRLGEMPGGRELPPGLHIIDGTAMLFIEGVARFRISGGSEIVVDPEPTVPAANVRLFLLGSALGALLHQRGLLPLHANAVEIGGDAVAFMGGSGSGKSTLAAWFHDQGHRILADDVCVVGFGPAGRPQALPGLPRFRLWRDAIEGSGRETKDFDRSYAGDEDYEKYDVPVAAPAAAAEPGPLRALYVLERGDRFGIEPLGGLDAAEAIIANTYRGGFLDTVGSREAHWQASIRLARSTPVFRCERVWGAELLDEQARAMRDHAQKSGGEN